MLGRGFDECLVIYSMEDWDQFAEGLASLPSNDPDARELARYFFSGTLEIEIDANGRAPLPPQLKKDIGIDKEVVFAAGNGKRAELWPAEVYDAKYLPADEEDAAAKRANINDIAKRFLGQGVSL